MLAKNLARASIFASLGRAQALEHVSGSVLALLDDADVLEVELLDRQVRVGRLVLLALLVDKSACWRLTWTAGFILRERLVGLGRADAYPDRLLGIRRARLVGPVGKGRV